MYTLYGQKEHKTLCAYSAKTKTDCFYKFDQNHFRKGVKIFIVENRYDSNIYTISLMPRDYPYREREII